MRFTQRAGAWLLASMAAFGASSASADGFVWEKVDGSMTATVSYQGQAKSFTYQSTGFRFNINKLAPISNSVNQLYANLSFSLHNAVLASVQSNQVSQYRSHYVSINGPLNLTLSNTGGAYAAVSLTGPSATVTMDLEDKKYGVSVSCRVVVTSGVLSASNGQLNLGDGSLTGLTLTAPSPTHSESCSTSLGWIPIIGTLIDKLATSTASNYLDGMFHDALSNANLTLQPLHFVGLDEALANAQWPLPNLADAASHLVSNLWAGFQGDVVSVTLAQAPNPGAYVTSDRLRIDFPKLGLSLRVSEYASYRQNVLCPPPRTACIPT